MIVTSWSPQGYEQYGKRFSETCPLPFTVVTDADLETDVEYLEFMRKYGSDPKANGIVGDQKNYRYDAVKFAKKVFALTGIECDDWLIWIDGDVEFTGPLEPVFEKVLRGDIAYLGRKDWDHSECGFVAYRMSNPKVREFLKEFRRMYLSGDVFHERETHDSWIFDVLRERFDLEYFNISEGVPGNHVWPETVLSEAMIHHKGPERKGMKVKTVNCVPDRNIHANILYSGQFFDRWLKVCKPHDMTAVVCSAGPSLKDHLDEIRKLKRKKDTYLVCVKHALNTLLEAGIVPDACVLLDPRPHVADFLTEIHPKVTYIVASMVHPVVVDSLEGAKVVAYHAAVNAGEEQIIPDQMRVSGGSASAFRGFFVLYLMGFRKFEMFGYDACFPSKDDVPEGKLLKVTVGEDEFYTTPEFWAQKQDLEVIVNMLNPRMNFHGGGMLASIYNAMQAGNADFDDYR